MRSDLRNLGADAASRSSDVEQPFTTSGPVVESAAVSVAAVSEIGAEGETTIEAGKVERLTALLEAMTQLSDGKTVEATDFVNLSNKLDRRPIVSEDGTSVTLKIIPGGLTNALIALQEDAPDKEFNLARWISVEANHTSGQQIEALINAELDKYNKQTEYLSAGMVQEYDNDMSIELLLPVLHDMATSMSADAREVAFDLVSAKLAKATVDYIQEHEAVSETKGETLVWAHDFHMLSVGAHVKEALPDTKVGYFHHVPFPEYTPEVQGMLQEQMPLLKRVFENVSKCDSLGFHTEKDAKNFVETAKHMGIVTNAEEVAELSSKIFVHPIGIPKQALTADMGRETGHSQATVQDRINQFNSGNVNGAQEEVVPGVHPTSDLHSLNQERATKWLGSKEEIGKIEFDPSKLHFSSVSRFDPIKGIEQLVPAYRKFLEQKKAEGIENPGEKYQLNVVAAEAVSNPRYQQFQDGVLNQIREINTEFPGSICRIPGIPPNEIAGFHAITNVTIAASPVEGYCIAAGEFSHIRAIALDEPGLVPEEARYSGVVFSDGLGISEEIGKKYESGLPESIKIIDTKNEEAFVAALNDHAVKWEASLTQGASQEVREIRDLGREINDIQDWGPGSLTHLKSEAKEIPTYLGENQGPVPASPLGRLAAQPDAALKRVASSPSVDGKAKSIKSRSSRQSM